MTATNPFAQSAGAGAHGIADATHVTLVTPHDVNDLTYASYLSFATAGDLKVITLGGETVVIPSGALAAGIIHPVLVTRVYANGTTALNIVAYR